MAIFYIFIGVLAIVHCATEASDSHCSSDSRSVGLSVSSSKNESGQWTDLFSACIEHSSALHSITMDVLHNITECDGRRIIHIQGSIPKGRDQFCRKEELENGSGGNCTEGCGGRDKIKAKEEINGTGNGRKLQLEANSTDEDWKKTVNQRLLEEKDREFEELKEKLKIAEKKIAEVIQEIRSLKTRDASDPVKEGSKKIQVGESEKGMVFHSRVGSNVKISNNGRTIEKKTLDEGSNGAAFTSRPLENDEIFEVVLDRRGSGWSFGFAIGVLTVRPEDFEFPRFATLSPHAWMYQHSHIYSNGDIKRSNYGVYIDKLPVGTRFGVMKKSDGDVHFFVNGEDQGSAVSGISGPLYGVVDLCYNAEKITILKP